MSVDDEVDQLAKVVDRLAERFPAVSRENVEQAVNAEYQALNGGRIRDYVPVLVEHAAKGRLRALPGTGSSVAAREN